MTDLFFLTIPFLGRIYIQRDTVTASRHSVELLTSLCGTEVLFSLGSLRVYLTPALAIAAERR